MIKIPNITTEPVLVRFSPLASNPYGYEMRWVRIVEQGNRSQGKIKMWCAPINHHDTRDFPNLTPKNKCTKEQHKKQVLKLFTIKTKEQEKLL